MYLPNEFGGMWASLGLKDVKKAMYNMLQGQIEPIKGLGCKSICHASSIETKMALNLPASTFSWHDDHV